MANRIIDSTYIIDTGSGNVSIPWNSGSHIQSISWWFANSSGELRLSASDTTNVIFRQVHPSTNNAGYSDFAMLGKVDISELKVPVLTACTAWINFA